MAEHRHGPVQTSAVYLIGQAQFPAEPPPSPPSPSTIGDSDLCSPIEELSLGPASPPLRPSSAQLGPPVLASPAVTAPPSPSPKPLDAARRQGGTDLTEDRLAGAIHVLSTEAEALASLARLYSREPRARGAFDRAVAVITRGYGPAPRRAEHDAVSASDRPPPPPAATAAAGGRGGGGGGNLVICGVGKSGHVARKLVATFNSLSVRASFLHPTEALHGDLGLLDVRRDAVMLVSFSGRTPELMALVPHLDARLPVVVLTAAWAEGDCPIAEGLRRARRGRLLLRGEEDGGGGGGEVTVLPAPIPVSEVECFGVAAPTSSTTAALALGDALAIVAAREIQGGSAARLAAAFGRNHPGGAIGAANATARGR